MNEPFERIIQKSQVEGLDVIPADKNLAGAAVELVNSESREYKLQGFLQSLREKYRFIILDCPPALDLLTLNALVARRCGSRAHPVRIPGAGRRVGATGHVDAHPENAEPEPGN